MGWKSQRVRSHKKQSGIAVPAYVRTPKQSNNTVVSGGGSRRDIKLEEATRNLTEANEPLVFPDPQIRKKVRIRWWGRMRRAIPKIEFRKYTMGRATITVTWFRGKKGGKSAVVYNRKYEKIGGGRWRRDVFPRRQHIVLGEGVHQDGWARIEGVRDFRGVDATNASWSVHRIDNVNLSGSVLTNLNIRPKDVVSGVTLHNVTFDGSSCQGLNVWKAEVAGTVSFRGCDVQNLSLENLRVVHHAVLDFRDTNLTREQLDEMVQEHHWWGGRRMGHHPTSQILFPSYSLEEAAEKLGKDQEALEVMVALGGYEVRNAQGLVVSPGDYSMEELRVPVWALEETRFKT